MSAFAQNRTGAPPTLVELGALIFPAAIQACKVCLETPISFAASRVV